MGGVLPPAERRSGALLAACVIASIVLLVLGERLPTAGLRAVGAWLFAPLDRVVLTADRMVAAWRETRVLHERVARLEIENQRLRVAAEENRRLRASLGLPQARGLRFVAAEVLALSGEGLPSAATLSAGAGQGVSPGDAVVTSDGLLGQITESYPGMSRAVLLTDPNSAVACEVESTGVLGVLRFSLAPSPRLVLTSVALSDTVEVGQRVLTAGLSRRFPRGLPVGRVRAVGRDPGGLTQAIEIEPAVRLSRLRHAFVIPRPEREIRP